MRKTVLAAGIAMLVLAGCSKPTELASEANAKYDRRDPVVAPPAIGEEVDTTPVEPVPGSAEAEALALVAEDLRGDDSSVGLVTRAKDGRHAADAAGSHELEATAEHLADLGQGRR